MVTVLFACVHNAGRSQIAAALFNRVADPAKARAVSAGTQPAPRVHPEVVEVMQEDGIDLSRAPTTRLTTEFAAHVDWLITMGCGDACPFIPGVARDDWPIDDPKGKSTAEVRAIREDIGKRVRALIAREHWDSTPQI
jgi:arsenate reductase